MRSRGGGVSLSADVFLRLFHRKHESKQPRRTSTEFDTASHNLGIDKARAVPLESPLFVTAPNVNFLLR
jgi:hypothetical protein